MRNSNQSAELYVKASSKPSKTLKYFMYGTFFITLPALAIVGTYTKDQRLDMAKEQILEGRQLTEVETQQKKIRQARYAIAYYCEDNPSDAKCSNLTQNDDRRYNPLGNIKEVNYSPKNGQGNGAFSWSSNIAPPMPKSGLGQSVKIISVKKLDTKKITKIKQTDKIKQVIAARY